jgi:hypothetical protein
MKNAIKNLLCAVAVALGFKSGLDAAANVVTVTNASPHHIVVAYVNTQSSLLGKKYTKLTLDSWNQSENFKGKIIELLPGQSAKFASGPSGKLSFDRVLWVAKIKDRNNLEESLSSDERVAQSGVHPIYVGSSKEIYIVGPGTVLNAAPKSNTVIGMAQKYREVGQTYLKAAGCSLPSK